MFLEVLKRILKAIEEEALKEMKSLDMRLSIYPGKKDAYVARVLFDIIPY